MIRSVPRTAVVGPVAVAALAVAAPASAINSYNAAPAPERHEVGRVRLSMIESRDPGGACYGDSGGPNFVTLDGRLVLAGTTITGDAPCYATSVAYRTDTDAARAFLGQFVTLP